MHEYIVFFIVVYIITVGEGLLGLTTTEAWLGILYYITMCVYMGVFNYFEFFYLPQNNRAGLHVKLRFLLDTIHTTMIVCFLFGAFSEFTSFPRVYQYSLISHVFISLPNMLLIYYNIGHIVLSDFHMNVFNDALVYIPLQTTRSNRHALFAINFFRVVVCVCFVWIVFTSIVFFNKAKT